MDDVKPNLIRYVGYHGTTTQHKMSIESHGFDPAKTKYRKDHWLGQGVYFFDDQHKADSWARQQSSHTTCLCQPIVYRSDIVVKESKLLNLDDREQVDGFRQYVAALILRLQGCGKLPVFLEHTENDSDHSANRAIFFDMYKKEKGISVIIHTFDKPNPSYSAFCEAGEYETARLVFDLIKIKYHELQICVSDKACITNTQMVNNVPCEVI